MEEAVVVVAVVRRCWRLDSSLLSLPPTSRNIYSPTAHPAGRPDTGCCFHYGRDQGTSCPKQATGPRRRRRRRRGHSRQSVRDDDALKERCRLYARRRAKRVPTEVRLLTHHGSKLPPPPSLPLRSRRRGHCHAVVVRPRRDNVRAAAMVPRAATPASDARVQRRAHHGEPSRSSRPLAHDRRASPASSCSLSSSSRSSRSDAPPSSLFDSHDHEHEDEAGHVLGWVSETARHMPASEMASSEIPSSASQISCTKRKEVNDPYICDAITAQRLPSSSPTEARMLAKRIRIAQRQEASCAEAQASDVPREASTASTPSSIGQRQHQSVPLSVRKDSSTSSSSRLPERPQSVMKHRSANEYSSGKNVPLIVVSANNLPTSTPDEGASGIDEELGSKVVRSRNSVDERHQASVSGRHKAAITAPSPLRQRRDSVEYGELQDSPHLGTWLSPASTDADAFSPPKQASRLWQASSAGTLPRSHAAAAAAIAAAPFVLRSRPSLPKTSFYERTKEEEGSPTPIRRKHLSLHS